MTELPGHPLLTRWCRPLCLGASIGHPLGGTGALGPFVILAGGDRGFLSASYVLSPAKARRGDMIHQPGPVDLAVATGRTRAAELTLTPPPGLPWVAAAQLLPEVEAEGNVVPKGLGLPTRPIGPPKEAPVAGIEVCLVGRSGLRFGRITAREVTSLTVHGDGDRQLPVTLDGALEVEGKDGPFSLAGDAGALVFTPEDSAAIGLVIASSQSHSYLLPLADVLDALGVQYLDA